MSRSRARAAAGDHEDICGLCRHQKPCGSPRSVTALTGKGEEATAAVALMTADSRMKKKDIEDFRDEPYKPPTTTPQSNLLDRKISKRTIKTMKRMM